MYRYKYTYYPVEKWMKQNYIPIRYKNKNEDKFLFYECDNKIHPNPLLRVRN